MFTLLIFQFHLDQKSKFTIGDEILEGRPLYLDAQATTPLVNRYYQFVFNYDNIVK